MAGEERIERGCAGGSRRLAIYGGGADTGLRGSWRCGGSVGRGAGTAADDYVALSEGHGGTVGGDVDGGGVGGAG